MSKKEPSGTKPKKVPRDAHDIATMASEATASTVASALPDAPPMPPQVKKQLNEKLGLTLHGLDGPSATTTTAQGSWAGAGVGGAGTKPAVAPTAPPPPPVAKAPAAAAPSLKNNEDPVARAICIRQLKRYQSEYGHKLGSFVPSNYTGLPLQQLQDLVAGCDGMLSEGSEFAILSSGVLMSLSFYERAVMPWLPQELPHAHAQGVAATAQFHMQDHRSPLFDALNRLSIKYTGMLETGPWGALFVSMHTLIAMQGEHNMRAQAQGFTAGDQQAPDQTDYELP